MSGWVGNGELSGKLNKKTLSRTFLWIVLISLTVTVTSTLVHDVKLNLEIVKLAITDVPEIRLENIKFERYAFGSQWKINIPNLERQKGVVRLSSIDISREFSNGDIWKIKGDNGEYIESSETAAFNEVSGSMVMDGQVFELYAPFVLWEKSGDLVMLSKGVVIKGGSSSISADIAKVYSGNLITIEKGGEIIWNLSSFDIKI